MRLYVVVDSELGAEVLRRVLPSHDRSELALVTGIATDDALSMAHTLHFSRQAPVVLVIDARTVDEDSIEEQRDMIGDLLPSIGPPGVEARVVMAVPDVAVALFHAPEVLERVAGVRLTERMRIEARFVPRAVLAEVVRLSGRFADEMELVGAIGPEDARKLAQHPLIQTLDQHVRELLDCAPARQEKLRRTG